MSRASQIIVSTGAPELPHLPLVATCVIRGHPASPRARNTAAIRARTAARRITGPARTPLPAAGHCTGSSRVNPRRRALRPRVLAPLPGYDPRLRALEHERDLRQLSVRIESALHRASSAGQRIIDLDGRLSEGKFSRADRSQGRSVGRVICPGDLDDERAAVGRQAVIDRRGRGRPSRRARWRLAAVRACRQAADGKKEFPSLVNTSGCHGRIFPSKHRAAPAPRPPIRLVRTRDPGTDPRDTPAPAMHGW